MPADTPPPTPETTPPSAAASSAGPAWGTWIAFGAAVLLTATALALATGSSALLEALDVGRWFR
ncbi:MAG: hypothetical protein U1E39_09960 [Planctomycetota bacterium]